MFTLGPARPEVWTACIAFMDALQKTDYQAMAENIHNVVIFSVLFFIVSPIFFI